MQVEPGKSIKLGNAAQIKVTNLGDKEGSFSVTGMNGTLEPDQSQVVDLIENDDEFVNSGKTVLEVKITKTDE